MHNRSSLRFDEIFYVHILMDSTWAINRRVYQCIAQMWPVFRAFASFFFFSFCHRTGSLWSEAEEINICKVPNNRLFGSMNGKQKADSMAFANDSDREKAIINGKIYSQQSCRQSSGVD